MRDWADSCAKSPARRHFPGTACKIFSRDWMNPPTLDLHMKRLWHDRILDRIWVEATATRSLPGPYSVGGQQALSPGSVSGTTEWPGACEQLVNAGDPDFRRRKCVREVVETLAPSDGRYHAGLVKSASAELLSNPAVLKVDAWGNPIRCPGFILGTPVPFSPTSLRYLSHAVWLKNEGKIKSDGQVVEIGVGFGGLAAMNRIVSGARTVMVDLPPVVAVAETMLGEVGLGGSGTAWNGDTRAIGGAMVVSNYAFSELRADLQDDYIARILRFSAHGMILSNAGIFARGVGGRNDDELIAALRSAGIPAELSRQDKIFGPSDYLGGIAMITW